ncbi:MAG: hypothetical protein LBN39_09345 [Planctomycetaceae bacterium]|nr:hypothetical protein [Planctomycetaceae bacterium]
MGDKIGQKWQATKGVLGRGWQATKDVAGPKWQATKDVIGTYNPYNLTKTETYQKYNPAGLLFRPMHEAAQFGEKVNDQSNTRHQKVKATPDQAFDTLDNNMQVAEDSIRSAAGQLAALPLAAGGGAVMKHALPWAARLLHKIPVKMNASTVGWTAPWLLGATGTGIDGELSRQVITVTIFETIAEAVWFRWMILVMEFAPIEDVQDVAGVDLLLRKLLQRVDEPLRRNLIVGEKTPNGLGGSKGGLLRCRNGETGSDSLRMLH